MIGTHAGQGRERTGLDIGECGKEPGPVGGETRGKPVPPHQHQDGEKEVCWESQDEVVKAKGRVSQAEMAKCTVQLKQL